MRVKKISVTIEEFNRYLVSKGLKPLPADYDQSKFTPSQGDPNVFGSDPQVVTPPVRSQPVWKWSWDPTGGLLIWPVDEQYGQPHHIEVTGPNFYNLAQGRVYETAKGGYEILVWEDRANEEWQDQAVEDVDAWLLANTGKESEGAYWQGEGGYYPTIGDGKPDTDKMIEAYFGVGMKELPGWKKQKLRKQYADLFGDTELAPDPVDQQRKNDDKWLEEMSQNQQLDQAWQQAYKTDASTSDVNCPQCGGEGTDTTGHLCLNCKGTGVDPRVGIAS